MNRDTDCHECDGTGYLSGGALCRACDGFGLVPWNATDEAADLVAVLSARFGRRTGRVMPDSHAAHVLARALLIEQARTRALRESLADAAERESDLATERDEAREQAEGYREQFRPGWDLPWDGLR